MKYLVIILFCLTWCKGLSQNFTRKDSLQGGLRPERTAYDVQRYDLNIRVNPTEEFISGYNDISFIVKQATQRIQVDLFENMQVDSIVFKQQHLHFQRDNHAVFITFSRKLKAGNSYQLRFYYSGHPVVAKRAPWDGGFVWSHDASGQPWVGVAVQGTGASLWYPVKDHQSDEPDRGASVKVAVPNGLMNISNGRLKGSEDLGDGYTLWDWEVKSLINNYDITINVGDYVHFGEKYQGLDLDYYVLRENLEKAIIQFEEVKPMMDCFPEKFGEYPFADDSFKLVETPYLGMEHQSAVAYGNHYQTGYLGRDLSGTGVGLLWDFIIIHESAHEWFGNSITSADIADMWIHEGFTTYAESVYVECRWGYEKAQKYINGLGRLVRNDRPIIGTYGLNKGGSGDMYSKGAMLLNTIRHIINDDEKWWRLLRAYAERFRHQIIDTQTVISFFNTQTGLQLNPIFEQYLFFKNLPELQIRRVDELYQYRWHTDVAGFKMPFEYTIDGVSFTGLATNEWQTFSKQTDFNKVDFSSLKYFYRGPH